MQHSSINWRSRIVLRLLPGIALLLSACATQSPTSSIPPAAVAPAEAPQPCACPAVTPVDKPAAPRLEKAAWTELPGWPGEQVAQAWPALLTGCSTLRRQAAWTDLCKSAQALAKPTDDQVRQFVESQFQAYRVINADGTTQGMITGYYEPLLRGSRKPGATFRFPLYGAPDDLVVVDLGEVYPELKSMRLRGRLVGKKIVPYYNRAQIDKGEAKLAGKELLWVDDAVELFFLQVQGSGRVRLENGEIVRVGYAEQNGYPYKSIGRVLIDRGELTLDKASMQGIKSWAEANPGKLADVLNANASYVFFRELPNTPGGPPGSLGVPLTGGRSLAIDPRVIPLGALVFLSTTWPLTEKPLVRLMLAQDTGGAIRGAVRADFFWGFGEDATQQAGKMRQQGQLWVMLPRGMSPPEPSK